VTHRIEWVRSSCRMLNQISAEFERTQPFAGMTIGTGIHLEPKTVALLLTLHARRRRCRLDGQPQLDPAERR
jgi:adenosylhomocysteinase